MNQQRTFFFLCLTTFFTLTSSLSAQEQLGLRYENYSGVNSLLLNPANNHTSKFLWDVNLVEAGLFFDNNYAYILDANISRILRATDAEVLPELEAPERVGDDVLLIDYFDNQRAKYAFAKAQVLGPSFMVNLPSGHTFGAFTRLRSAVGDQNFPWSFSYCHFNRTPFFEDIDIDPFKIAGMVWSEIGINYGYRFFTNNGVAGFGLNLKYLQGYEAFYANSDIAIDIAQLPNDSFALNQGAFDFGFTNSNADPDQDFQRSRNGTGFGVDLGFVYVIGEDEQNYQLKIGASLLDFGAITFNKNAESHTIDTDQAFTLAEEEFNDVDNLEEAVQQLSLQTLSDQLGSRVGNEFTIWLPGALSLQADLAIVPNFFVNGTIVQRLPVGNKRVERGNLLAVAPRYESRWFGLSIPVSLYNYQRFNIGAAIRLAFVTIGTENLGSFIGRSQFTGADIYAAVKVNPFHLNFGGNGGGRNRRGIPNKKVRCYKF